MSHYTDNTRRTINDVAETIGDVALAAWFVFVLVGLIGLTLIAIAATYLVLTAYLVR